MVKIQITYNFMVFLHYLWEMVVPTLPGAYKTPMILFGTAWGVKIALKQHLLLTLHAIEKH